MRIRRFALEAALVAAVGTGACAGGHASRLRMPGPARTMVHVRNSNWADMDVYALRDGQRFRLGTVTGMGMADFEIPPALLSGSADLQLMADPIGSPQVHVSAPIPLRRGATIDLQLESNLALSNVTVH